MPHANAAVAAIRNFIDADPAKAAHAIEPLDAPDGAAIMAGLPPASAAACLEKMQPACASAILRRLLPDPGRAVLALLPPFITAELVMGLPKGEREVAIELLEPEAARAVAEILTYPKQSAGRLMKKNFLSFRTSVQVQEVTTRLRALAKKQAAVTYCYVVDEDNRLVGVLNMRDLILAGQETPIGDIMIREVYKISPYTDRETLVALFKDKRYFVMPVVDEKERILGVVNTAAIVESSEQEAAEDLQILFGASPEERPYSPIWFKIRKRMPWLTINLATAFLAAIVVAVFEGLISRVAVLAVFLPIIAGQGGNAGIQSLSVVLRGIIMREVDIKQAFPLVKDEIAIGLVTGLVVGVITGVAAFIWKGNPYLGLVAAFAMVVNMVAACVSGALIPVLMKRWGFDPAHSSGIFITTVTDIVGVSALLGSAYLMQAHLIR